MGFSVGVGLLILAIYLVHPIAGGHRFPIGPDGSVYVWWSRYVDAEGLGVLPGRFGLPSVALILGTVFGTDPLGTVAVLGPVLATASGLAAGALTEALLGPNLIRSFVAAVLTAAWTGHIAAGYLGNLSVATLFLCAIAAFGLAETSWRAVIFGGALLATAALTHRSLVLLCTAILGGAILLLAPEVLRRRRLGAAVFETAAGRLTAGILAGTPLGIGLGSIIAGPGPDSGLVETSQDAFLRTRGLGDELRRQFRLRLAADSLRTAVPMVGGAALGVVGAIRGAWEATPEARFLLAVCGSWAAVSLVGIPALLLAGGPANRLLTFALFFPLIAAVGFEVLRRRGRGTLLMAMAGGLAIAAVSMYGWYRQEPFIHGHEIENVEATRATIDALPPGTAVVFLVDTEEKAAAFHVTRFANVIRTTVPEERIADVRVAVGSPDDYLAGRPTLTGNPEHDRLSTAYLEETRTEPRVVFVAEPFNGSGFATADRLGTRVAPGVVVLPTAAFAAVQAGPADDEPPGVEPVALTAMSLGALLFLAILGAGWTRWGLPGASLEGILAAAPSAGLASVVLGALGSQILGFSAGGAGGVGAALLIGAAGYAFAARLRRRGR